MDIFTKEEKKVEYLELIYDLIFVYMIGRDNSLLENVENGFVTPAVFAAYILCTLSIIQIWSFTTFYINMFGRNGVRDHIFLLVNMYLLYFLGEATRLDAARYIMQYHVAWGLILTNIGLQYVIELRNHRMDVWNRQVIRMMSLTLFVEAAIAFVAGTLSPLPAAAVSFAAILAGIVLTFFGRSVSVGGQVDFMHLSERAMLYVVFTFGEMVVAIAVYFAGSGSFDPISIYYSLLTFLIAAGLFLSYEIVYDYLINREGAYNGLLYMLIHIFIVFALNNLTISFTFMREPGIAVLPKILMLTASLIGYFFFLFMLKSHFKLQCRLDPAFIAKMIVLSAAFFFLMIFFSNRMAVNIALSVLYVAAVLFVLYRMKAIQDVLTQRREKQD